MKLIFTSFLLGFYSFAFAQSGYNTNDQPNQQSFVQTAGLNIPNVQKVPETSSEQVIIIPVVIHVLYNNQLQNISDQQIQSFSAQWFWLLALAILRPFA